MAQVMHAGAVASTAVGNAGLPQKSAEILVDIPKGQRPPGRAREEPLPAAAPHDMRVVVDEPGTKRLAERRLPVFAALGGTDPQDPGVDVDIRDAKQAGFGGT